MIAWLRCVQNVPPLCLATPLGRKPDNISRLLFCLSIRSEAEEAHARLIEAAAKLDASEACCRELEGKLSLLQKKSENALGEERLKVTISTLNVPTSCAMFTQYQHYEIVLFRILGTKFCSSLISTILLPQASTLAKEKAAAAAAGRREADMEGQV